MILATSILGFSYTLGNSWASVKMVENKYKNIGKIDRTLPPCSENFKHNCVETDYYLMLKTSKSKTKQIMAEGAYKNNKLHGFWIWYWDNGNVWKKGNYVNGKENGLWVNYHYKGRIDGAVYKKDGKSHGKFVKYYFDGKIQEITIFENGIRNGNSVIYWDNGQLRQKGDYKNGKKDGYWISNDKNGHLISKFNYIEGINKASPIIIQPKKSMILNNIKVIAAGSERQMASWEEDSSHSLFTKYFLKAMSGEGDSNKDGKVSDNELKEYLFDTMTYYARRYYGRDQKVQIHNGG